ncbi:hypothetical protein B0H16DRAFT_1530128 [Mycena metata]|uniref:Uncharacterized protein n=1 Tax=Mycena metata TaxID=1033252 RepID=A0AAD7JGS4_9AGAR|nr:hypothetical protein B0H16DRAFT_1530128 [Mycena metata]
MHESLKLTLGDTAAVLMPSTNRPMNAQTARSFEARMGATIPRVSTSNALSRSSTVVTFGDVASSEAEIFTQAGLLASSKGEKAPDRKAHQDENNLRISTHIVPILHRIEELERRGNAQHPEVCLCLEDIQRNTPANASPESLAKLQADIAAIKARATPGRVAIAGATEALNNLVRSRTCRAQSKALLLGGATAIMLSKTARPSQTAHSAVGTATAAT